MRKRKLNFKTELFVLIRVDSRADFLSDFVFEKLNLIYRFL